LKFDYSEVKNRNNSEKSFCFAERFCQSEKVSIKISLNMQRNCVEWKREFLFQHSKLKRQTSIIEIKGMSLMEIKKRSF